MTKYHGAKKILLGLKKSTSVLALASAVTVGLVAGTSSASAQDVGKSSYKVVLNFADGNKFVTDYNDVTASYVAGLAKDLADSYVSEKGSHGPVLVDGNTYYYNFSGKAVEDKSDYTVVYKLPNGSEQKQEYKSLNYDDFIGNVLVNADAMKDTYGEYVYDLNNTTKTYTFTFKGLPTEDKSDYTVVYKLPNGSEQTQEYKSLGYDEFITNTLANADAMKESYGEYTYDVNNTTKTYTFTFQGLPEEVKGDYKIVFNFADGNRVVTEYKDVTESYVASIAKDLADSYVAEKGEHSPVFIDGNTYYYNFAGLTKEDPKADDKEKPSTDSDKKADKDTSKASDKKSAKDGPKEAASKKADKASGSVAKSQKGH